MKQIVCTIAIVVLYGCVERPSRVVEPDAPIAASSNQWTQRVNGLRRLNVQLEPAFGSLSFVRPTDLQFAGGNAYVAEQSGRVLKFDPLNPATAAVVLDITDLVSQSGGEEGLLGLAVTDGALYVNYSGVITRRTVVASFSEDTAGYDRSRRRTILEYDQPFPNHNGGQLAFGPEGLLYVASGDGGFAYDPDGHGQNRDSLLGAILRIRPTTDGYDLPDDNPLVDGGGRPELFAWGLRNPWRMSFDRKTGRLWAADVGQDRTEEVNVIHSGGNYGWAVFEGSECLDGGEDCDGEFVDPVTEYGHDLGQSVTGGYVWRSSRIPELDGTYLYADFVSGRIWALLYDGVNPVYGRVLIEAGVNISTFGQDPAGEVYLVNYDGSGERSTGIFRLAVSSL